MPCPMRIPLAIISLILVTIGLMKATAEEIDDEDDIYQARLGNKKKKKNGEECSSTPGLCPMRFVLSLFTGQALYDYCKKRSKSDSSSIDNNNSGNAIRKGNRGRQSYSNSNNRGGKYD